MEQLNEVNVVSSSPEVVFQEYVYGRFKNEGIIDSNASNPRLLVSNKVRLKVPWTMESEAPGRCDYHQVPARGSATGYGAIHDIVGNQEHSLELKFQTQCHQLELNPVGSR